MNKSKIIGIVGGVGPFAGVDLAEKILNQTHARRDQDHVPFMLYSLPQKIPDRSKFILEHAKENPAQAVYEIIIQMEAAGASVIGIPCNTMHAPAIFDVLNEKLARSKSKVILLHMIEEVVGFIKRYYPHAQSIGYLSTSGTYRSGVYRTTLEENNYQVIEPDSSWQNKIHDSIYHPEFGIKAFSKPVKNKAKNQLFESIEHLKDKGAQAVILGCTEIAFAISQNQLLSVPLIDATKVLARVLIEKTYPDQLKTYSADNS
jgi:aspartate racemase